jgi:tyrosyl-tRNA synthetase
MTDRSVASENIPKSAWSPLLGKNFRDLKIARAFCDDRIEGNPIFEYIRYILFRWFGGRLTLCGTEYTDIEGLTGAFPSMDKQLLKVGVADYVNRILQPVRDHFASSSELTELVRTVAAFHVTR